MAGAVSVPRVSKAMTSEGWSCSLAWKLGIIRYDDDGDVIWAGERHLDAEDEPYGEWTHDHIARTSHAW